MKVEQMKDGSFKASIPMQHIHLPLFYEGKGKTPEEAIQRAFEVKRLA